MRASFAGWLVAGALAGCDRTPPEETPQGFCAVRDTFASQCVVCHGGSSPQGGLDLATDPIAALVGVRSPNHPDRTLVVIGSPDASFLVAKLEGTSLTATEGDVMPPAVPLDPAAIAAIREWITAGATPACDADTDVVVTDYHPDGWSAPEAHGFAADRQEQECRTCHGDELGGGSSGVSCDSCHAGGWRTDCTYCHGGTDDATGAPPEDVLGESDPLLITFPAHSAHVSGPRHPAYDCVQCHDKPVDVLSVGHFLVGDDTPDVAAENTFTGGLAPQATWTGTACANTYCHGSGRTNGTGRVGETYGCADCHATATSNESAIAAMSGEHHMHVWDVGLSCAECHADTVSSNTQIADAARHVNGVKDVALPAGMTRNAQGCTGLCHLQAHYQEPW